MGARKQEVRDRAILRNNNAAGRVTDSMTVPAHTRRPSPRQGGVTLRPGAA